MSRPPTLPRRAFLGLGGGLRGGLGVAALGAAGRGGPGSAKARARFGGTVAPMLRIALGGAASSTAAPR